jgi:hypothetical protein
MATAFGLDNLSIDIDRKNHLSQFTILFIRQLHDMFRPQSGHHQVLKPI